MSTFCCLINIFHGAAFGSLYNNAMDMYLHSFYKKTDCTSSMMCVTLTLSWPVVGATSPSQQSLILSGMFGLYDILYQQANAVGLWMLFVKGNLDQTVVTSQTLCFLIKACMKLNLLSYLLLVILDLTYFDLVAHQFTCFKMITIDNFLILYFPITVLTKIFFFFLT